MVFFAVLAKLKTNVNDQQGTIPSTQLALAGGSVRHAGQRCSQIWGLVDWILIGNQA